MKGWEQKENILLGDAPYELNISWLEWLVLEMLLLVSKVFVIIKVFQIFHQVIQTSGKWLKYDNINPKGKCVHWFSDLWRNTQSFLAVFQKDFSCASSVGYLTWQSSVT